jgi:EAL domain-containing protein (putative c-di-GMP-specific phosphodiesterase class I)
MALRKALETPTSSTLAYQPVVDRRRANLWTASRLCCAGTTRNWVNVSPGRFIPLAEDARLDGRRSANWVLHRACREAVSWPADLKRRRSMCRPSSFTSQTLRRNRGRGAVRNAGSPPQRLELEVTESVFLRDGARAGADARPLILALGVGLSLDDFGTGYSALGYLSKTQFTTIKVDRSFVQGAARRDASKAIAIIRAVVALADSLGMSTTAEGAETENEVRNVIRELGCKKYPGLLLRSPDGRRGCGRAVRRSPRRFVRLTRTVKVRRARAPIAPAPRTALRHRSRPVAARPCVRGAASCPAHCPWR